VQEAIQEARRRLVHEKILKATVLDKPVRSLNSHDTDNYDWRYLAAASCLFH
jgi:hypothetical protein